MKKIILIISIIFFSISQVFANQDYLIINNGRLTDISIEDNTVVDVYPLITIMNEKNTLIVHPLKNGKTRFWILKNKKEKVIFNIEITENETKIDEIEGFDILEIDAPEGIYDFTIDSPPENLGGS